MSASRCSGPGKFIDECDLRMAFEEGIQIHFIEAVTVIVNARPRNQLEPVKQGLSFRPPMRFDDPYDNVGPFSLPCLGGQKHLVCLANTWCRTEKNLETAAAS